MTAPPARPPETLLVTWDGAGNLPPARSLVRALVRNGHRVRVLAHDGVKPMAERDGAEYRPVAGVPHYDSRQAMDPATEMPWVVENIWWARGFGDALVAEIERRRPDVLLVDICLTHALVAARRSGIPTAVIAHFPYHLLVGPFAPLLDGMLPQTNAYANELGLAPFASHQALVESAPLVFVHTYRPFEPIDEFAPNVVHVGPCHSDGDAAAPWTRRSPGRPLVVVGLSTSNQSQGPLLQRICDALAELDVEALVTSGPAIPPESLRAGANATVVEFVPHERVVPSADLLVTHAGHGTVMTGVSHGVPLLCLPMGRDQPMNAERVARLGLGAIVNPDASTAEIRDAIARTLADAALAQRSRAFARGLDGHPGLAEAVGLLCALAADLPRP